LNSRLQVLALMLVLSGCARPAAPPDDSRERAYRANNLGVALLEQFKYPEAAEAFRQALAVDGSLAIARVNLSIALLYALDLEGAAREAAEGARLLPSAPEPRYVLGLAARSENRTADAQREFERVRQLAPGDVGTDINLGQIYLEQRQYPEAIETLRRAVAAEPYNVTAAYNLGLALTRNGQADEGRQMLERAQTLRSAGYAVTFGTGYLEQGRYAEAIASSGNEAGLVDTAAPANRFVPAAVGTAPPAPQTPASPFGRRFASSDLAGDGPRAIASSLGGCVAPMDVDGDADLDLFEASPGGQRLFRNDNGSAWTDVTSASGLGAATGSVPIGCLAGDYDNDGRTDLFVLGYGGHALFHNVDGSRFEDVTAKAGIPPYPYLPGAAAWADVDHDGDLDLIVAALADLAASKPQDANRSLEFPRDFAPAPLLLLRNNGNGSFADVTAAARLTSRGHAIAVVPTDFDNRRDIDLLIVYRDGPPVLFQNVRDGTFRDVAADVGLAAIAGTNEVASAAAADVNKDEFPDFFFGRSSGSAFAISDGRGRFVTAPAPDADASRGSQLADYDNDGLLDLVTWGTRGPSVFRNLGGQWSDVTEAATRGIGTAARGPTTSRGFALADVSGDGSTDLITGGQVSLAVWRNQAESVRNRSLRVHVTGRVSNRLGVGSKIQFRSGSLKGRLETSAATPPVAPADLVFGLGTRTQADVVRVLWPSGVLQAETVQLPSGPSTPLRIEELDRKPSSCPFLFTWNGRQFEFVTDFMGGGEMGYLEAPGRYNKPDPIEYVRIRGDQLQPKDGRFQIRVTNELEEVLFADRMQLMAFAHPEGTNLYPNEGMTEPPKPFRLFAVADERTPPVHDQHGHDVTALIASVDRRAPDDFALDRIRGYAAEHALTVDLTLASDSPVLLLTGWTDYAFSSDNVAAHQAGRALMPPALQIRDARGRWRTAIADIGIPVGRPQTIPVDLARHLRRGEHEVRIVTNMRIYWDRIAVGRGLSSDLPHSVRLDPSSARLHSRGFSAEIPPAGHGPLTYRYDEVSRQSPWKTLSGRYTREGDVRELLLRADDMFVIAKPGDEIAIEFEASLPPLAAGWTRTFLLIADGYSKEMDINSASPDAVEPLPFHAMSGYPYNAPERYPETPEHERYRATYNTRAVIRGMATIDQAVGK
jgi:tetratricopeptide (TPR) repeat protein